MNDKQLRISAPQQPGSVSVRSVGRRTASFVVARPQRDRAAGSPVAASAPMISTSSTIITTDQIG